jgi:alpha-L-fucosidase
LVGHNTSLILGVTPNLEGLIPEADATRLIESGEEIDRRFSNPVASTSGSEKTMNLRLPERQSLKQVVLLEDIAHGECVRVFIIE